jgi:hypothetical protein
MTFGTNTLAFAFLAPALMAAGAAAISIPIAIHFLNRQKFRVVVWAAMGFLLAAHRRNAKRLQLHRLILLALRCLALLLLAAGMAQLVINSNVIAGALGGQRVVVVVWDDSYSMGYQKPGEVSSFDKSKKLLADWLSGGGDAQPLGPTDKVLVIKTSTATAAAAGAGNQPTLDHAALLAQVRGAHVSDSGADLEPAIEEAAQALKGLDASTRTRQVILLTDFSKSSVRSGALASESSVNERLKKQMAVLAERATEMRVLDVGAVDQANMAITDLQPVHSSVVVGAPAEFKVTVVNATLSTQSGIPVTLSVDGLPVHTEKFPTLEPGASKSIIVEATLPTAGRHVVEARLPADMLPLDDVRRLMVNARKEIPILLVEGSPGSTVYLWAAYGLSVDGKFNSVFAPRRITELELPTTVLSDYAEVVLADTAVPTPAMAETLRRFVDAGGLLMIFPGDRTNATLMNSTLSTAGLLPATLGQPVRLDTSAEMEKGIQFAPEGYTHPILEKFRDSSKNGADYGFLSVQTNEYFKLGVPQDGSVETLLRYEGPNGTPGDAAIVTKPVGKGRVVLFASSADNQWNTWGGKPSYVPVIHELTYYVMPRDSEAMTLRVGDRLNLSAEDAAPGEWSGPHSTTVSVSAAMAQDGRMRLSSEPLMAAGLYGPASVDGRPMLAVNPDGTEADIRHISSAQMASTLGVDAKLIDEHPQGLMQQVQQGAEGGATLFGPALIAAALMLFIAEAILAMVFSTYR